MGFRLCEEFYLIIRVSFLLAVVALSEAFRRLSNKATFFTQKTRKLSGEWGNGLGRSATVNSSDIYRLLIVDAKLYNLSSDGMYTDVLLKSAPSVKSLKLY